MSDFIATPSDMVERYFTLAHTIIHNLNNFKNHVSRVMSIEFDDWTDADHELALKIWNLFQTDPIPRLGSNEHILPVLTPDEAEELGELTETIGMLESEVYILYINLTPRVSGYVTQAQREAADKKCKACLCS